MSAALSVFPEYRNDPPYAWATDAGVDWYRAFARVHVIAAIPRAQRSDALNREWEQIRFEMSCATVVDA